MCIGPHTLIQLHELDFGNMSQRSSCGASLGNVKISDLDFADDPVFLAKTLVVLVEALEALNEEAETLVLQVSWVKTKIQALNDIMDAAILSVPVCGEDVHLPWQLYSCLRRL